ncbi:hypothetical protein EB796_024480 [Bugula neritina]|uniref:Uncharacterized protein n=1 Tax=Bugula neritina TaxID=10212 RepID=A0A7J7ITS7_BUGNE|nr:hypothetical protein EB796_024480 [Bugula neritina]
MAVFENQAKPPTINNYIISQLMEFGHTGLTGLPALVHVELDLRPEPEAVQTLHHLMVVNTAMDPNKKLKLVITPRSVTAMDTK